jgi:hypothetical protein
MSAEWNIYRTRFLVRAQQLTEPFAFTDALGRDHRGSPGDYLVQSSEGLLRIAPREIFEDIYVVMRNFEVDCRDTEPALFLAEAPSEAEGLRPQGVS